MSTNPAVWAQAICTLAVLTYLYKDNPIWRLAETVYLGLGAAYWFIYFFWNFLVPYIQTNAIENGQWHYLLAVVFSLLIYFRYVPSMAWIARYPMSFWVGYGTGYALGFGPAVWLTQIRTSFYPLNSIENVLIVVGILAVLVYFFFTVAKDNPVIAGVAEVGKWYIMIALGSAFGNTILYRWNLFLARANLLIVTWLGVSV